MFGKLLNQGKQIIEGWTNNFLGLEEELSEKRMKICQECPLYNESADRCDSKRCYDKETGQITNIPGKNRICGCNCVMKAATRSVSKRCVLGKW